MHDRIPPQMGPLYGPQAQRYRDYTRMRQMSTDDLLMENRIIFLGSSRETGGYPEINDYLANLTIQKLLFLQYENRTQEIHMYINCPGGSVSATLAIYDTMQFLECPIATYCMGVAASGAAIILAAGTKGRRYALPNSKIMIHQPLGGAQGQASDIEIHAREILRTREQLNKILADRTGQSLEKIAADTERDYFMTAPDAAAYGLIDSVLEKRQ